MVDIHKVTIQPEMLIFALLYRIMRCLLDNGARWELQVCIYLARHKRDERVGFGAEVVCGREIAGMDDVLDFGPGGLWPFRGDERHVVGFRTLSFFIPSTGYLWELCCSISC